VFRPVVKPLQPARLTFASLAAALNDSPSQLHQAARRAAASSLLSDDLRKPRYEQLLGFLDGGVRFAFPA